MSHNSINPLMDGLSFVLKVNDFCLTRFLLNGHSFFIDLANGDFYKYFIDNQRTSGHQTIIFGLRELNETEMDYYCSNISLPNYLPIDFDSPVNFTVNYEIRTYTSGCYYLDANNVWRSDGLRVSKLYLLYLHASVSLCRLDQQLIIIKHNAFLLI